MTPAPPRAVSSAHPSQTRIATACLVLLDDRPRAIVRHAHAPSGKADTTSTSKIQPATEPGKAGSGPDLPNDPPRYQ
jgi:hypothetical protein